MDVSTFIGQLERSLSNQPGVIDVTEAVVRRTAGSNRAVFQVRLHFFDSSMLNFREGVDTTPSYPEHFLYSYHYIRNDEQVFRYDNSPHHRELPLYPEHKHVGAPPNEDIVPRSRPRLRQLIGEIHLYLPGAR